MEGEAMNNDIKTKDILGSCSSGIPGENRETSTTGRPDVKSSPVSGSSLDKAPVSSTYVATIRTPLDHQMDGSIDGADESLMGMESDGPRSAGRLDRMRSRARDISGTARERADELKSSLSHRAETLSHQVGDKAAEIRHAATDKAHLATENARTTLRSNPTNAMVIAAGLGLALGFMMHRKH